ncbi:hypothetical protein RchiOBHm_Chr3g0457931 [Rosa chinensis]|uniref:Uncharacterized protein n=1 Tax=Rosa chinensis TaxID=74649 RepID=A0A2P6R7P9_ROSCH|nr:hypothetical protein RchiOBHm_Chr3g0457931 [Rosa chinensis]
MTERVVNLLKDYVSLLQGLAIIRSFNSLKLNYLNIIRNWSPAKGSTSPVQ